MSYLMMISLCRYVYGCFDFDCCGETKMTVDSLIGLLLLFVGSISYFASKKGNNGLYNGYRTIIIVGIVWYMFKKSPSYHKPNMYTYMYVLNKIHKYRSLNNKLGLTNKCMCRILALNNL